MSALDKIEDPDKKSFLDKFKDFTEGDLPVEYVKKNKRQLDEISKPARIKTGMYAAIPIKCYAEKCEFADTCPLQKQGIAPEGYKCPIELPMVGQFMNDYTEQLHVDENNMVEMSLIRNLVNYEVQYLRAQKVLAKESFIQENFMGVDAEGKVMIKKELHLAVGMMESLEKRQKELLKQLMASREAKAKLGQGQLDTAQALASLMSDARRLQDLQGRNKLTNLGIIEHSPIDEEYDDE